jgi:hypothetical protein
MGKFVRDPFPVELVDWRERPAWTRRYFRLGAVLDRLEMIREMSVAGTMRALHVLSKMVDDPDWKVRLEVVRMMRFFLARKNKKVQKRAREVLHQFELDPHPMVEICVVKLQAELKNSEG